MFGQMLEDKARIFSELREHNKVGVETLGFSWSNLLLHTVPALRYLPRFLPYVRLMETVKL